MAAVSRLASDTVESSFSSSSSTVPVESLQDMSDADLLSLRDQTRFVCLEFAMVLPFEYNILGCMLFFTQ